MDSSKTKAEARQKATAFLAKMKTKGWKIRVHENMGWHYSLLNGGLSIHADKHKGKYTYHCMLGTDPGSGDAIWTARGEGYYPDPNKAVKFAVEYARKVIDGYAAVLEAAEEVLTVKV